jgi:hypothetical protein
MRPSRTWRCSTSISAAAATAWCWRALFGRWGLAVIFASGELAEARQANDVALGHIGKPYEVETVLRSLEVAREVMDGGTPQHLSLGFELFAAAG